MILAPATEALRGLAFSRTFLTVLGADLQGGCGRGQCRGALSPPAPAHRGKVHVGGRVLGGGLLCFSAIKHVMSIPVSLARETVFGFLFLVGLDCSFSVDVDLDTSPLDAEG